MLEPGQRIAHFELLEKLGAGGMGVVYKARDTQLDRLVALKVLPPARAEDSGLRARLLREARAASSLNHPNVVTVHQAGSDEGVDFIAMEYVDGLTLDQRIPPGGMPVPEAVAIGRTVAAALAAAHAAGIVHRDLKPGNVMVRRDGVVKVMDFGLAKALAPSREEIETRANDVTETAAGTVLGTGPYMSPEQAEGRAVDARSDVFSFGATLYEMLTGRRAFQGDTPLSTLSAVLKDTPLALHHVRPKVTPPLEQIVDRCLQKKREARYPSGVELAAALTALDRAASPPRSRRWPLALRLILLGVVLAGGIWLGIGQWRARWVHNQAIPEIKRLLADQKYLEAYQLARRARRTLPGDALLEAASARCIVPVPFESQPPGARVYYRPYLNPDAPEELLGQTPGVLGLPMATIRVRLAKDGFEDTEGTVDPMSVRRPSFLLDARGARPPGMVRIPANPSLGLPTFWLDKYEVTNRQFKLFVDQGGYHKRECWKHPFLNGGREISWEQAMPLFVDSTGRPGPSTWELGTYPEHQDDYPVGGVSWYEAAAYAEFAGKSLPAVAHWQRAAGFGYFSDILRLSNFGGQGPLPVTKLQGLGPFGTYGMAGNVREWCFNAVGSHRAILGGAWNEAPYKYRDFDVGDPIERLPMNGFRCAKFDAPPPAAALAPILQPSRDPSKETPVGDETFRAWRSSFAYDRTPLEAKVEALDDSSEYYRKEKITYAAAYGGERVLAWLFLPKNVRPLYQTVIYFPSGEASLLRSSEGLGPQRYLLFAIRSGRALLYPVYKGTYERFSRGVQGPNAVRELTIQQSKDLGRSIDYLETRPDVDHAKLAYFGISMGCRQGITLLPVEPRVRAAVLAWCGVPPVRAPEGTDPLDFAPRFKIPALLLEGRNDFIFPYTTSQLPLFRLLGTPAKDKKMMLYDMGHIAAFSPEMIKETLNWLDGYLGPVP